MELTVEKALEILNNFRGKYSNDNWIEHAICVGNTAEKIAEALNLDSQKAKTLGYIHDIGKGVGEFDEHPLNGYNYIKELGYDDEYANICLTHSYLNNDTNCCSAGKPKNEPFVNEFIKNHEYTIYEKLINLCDLMCTMESVTIEKRLIDLIVRYGVNNNTQYHVKETIKLKEEFDNKLGFNIYNLFPDMKNRI